ncbi:DNA-3-methyladenine glycosylase [Metallumcola ferriviriculae]|uniref:Putative 3-methyladenine DNA glycosylase n=1 Tax=Metallumcola ferriviriculae TaxID=3039180 RepID=A0AAU0UR25_9FIRM|nr:DNA-3-methyladenine glycosylase [Desulfitibacteraceae bacterium MK1]
MSAKLPKEFYQRPADIVARELLGKELFHETEQGTTSGLIVEAEAYLGPGDDASHSARGKTKRNAAMFGPAGHAYVYLIYGIHHCFNITTDLERFPTAVLIRALEPRQGVDIMQRRRGIPALRQLCSGPGKLAQAMAFNLGINGCNLQSEQLFVSEGITIKRADVVVTTRIGISKAVEKPLRFYLAGNQHVSVR